METGLGLISRERIKQVERNGWTLGHDKGHNHGELAINAAICACNGTDARVIDCEYDFGLTSKHGYDGEKPDRIKLLAIAGALIAAEIDRLQG